jgi:hypothetical protein
METQPPQLTSESPVPPATAPPKSKPAVPKGFARCRAHNRSGSRCRLHVQDPATGLCFRHKVSITSVSGPLDDSLDLSSEILAKVDGAYHSPETISSLLSNIIELVAQGRLSPRRAAVMTYAFSLMLRTSVAHERQVEKQLPLDYIPRRELNPDADCMQ